MTDDDVIGTELCVKLIAYTEFCPPTDVPWETDSGGGSALVEFAGRACYQSWGKPNPRTATNAGYVRHIIEVGHFSVLEHASATFYVTGVSRSLTHELVRHRHLSFSQLSQRYVDESNAEFVLPPALRALYKSDSDVRQELDEVSSTVRATYSYLVGKLTNLGMTRKEARQAARCALPNMTETKIVVTGNYRTWRHFIALRATQHADVEIRRLAIKILLQLQAVAPNVFDDFAIGRLDDGTRVASTTFHET